MTIDQLAQAMDTIAPPTLAESWDNVGLLVGDRAQKLTGVLLTLDLTEAVFDEAVQQGCSAVVAYHPPIFDPIKKLNASSLVFRAIRAGIAIHSPHTALDSAPGGTNDMLAEVLGLRDARPVRVATSATKTCKLVTFVPASALEAVSDALFDAGAGRIGQYSRCSFRSAGTGTFMGDASTNPTVGKAGQFEQADEIRLETVVSLDRLSDVVAALRASHPYEEPAFDLVQLSAEPTGLGMGRIGSLDSVDRPAIFDRIRQHLGIGQLLVAGPTTGPVSCAAACPGSCGKLMNDAISAGAQLYLTGEIRHHDALAAAARGVTVVCTLHSHSERAILKRIGHRLEQQLPGVPIRLSQADRDPFTIL